MTDLPLSRQVLKILKTHRLLDENLENELRALFSVPLEDLKQAGDNQGQDQGQTALAEKVADALATKLGIEPSGPTCEQQLRSMYPSLEKLRLERQVSNEDNNDSDTSVLESFYPSMKKD
jgi:hypothetical protein